MKKDVTAKQITKRFEAVLKLLIEAENNPAFTNSVSTQRSTDDMKPISTFKSSRTTRGGDSSA